MVGDFDPAQAIQLAERHFGHFQAKPIPDFRFEPQPALTARTPRDVYGQETAWVEMAWRFEGAGSEEALVLPLIAGILHNYQAGLFDLNITQKQRLLEAFAYPRVMEDYSSLILHAKPREGQSLEEVEQILLEQIDHLQKGNFEDWLPKAVLKDLKLSETKEFEKNQGRANAISNAFILGIEWSDMVQHWKKLEKFTKADIVALAQKLVRTDNYGVVFKHNGQDDSVMKVDKPPITPIEVNRSDMSGFAQHFLEQTSADVEPQFVDFKEVIKTSTIFKNLKLRSVNNQATQLFRLYYAFDMGRLSDRKLGLAASYLPFLGTSRYTASEMQQAFYRLGVHFSTTCQDDHFFLTLTGLQESLEEGIQLMEHLLADMQPNPDALQNLVADTLLRWDNYKKDKRTILMKGMASYAKYGAVSPFTDKMTKEQLSDPNLALELIDLLKGLTGYKHEIFYCGPKTSRTVANILKRHHPESASSKAPVPAKKYPEISTKKDKVYFVHFPMVQLEMLMLSKGTPKFNLAEYVFSEWYNQYFGYGLSSIVFQDIRESKALAYSAYAIAANPSRKDRAHFLQSYIGTQPDKLHEAVEAFQTILETMPVSLPQMENARQSVLKQIASGRIKKADLYWTWRANRDKGFPNHDLRTDIYHTLEKASAADLIHYQQGHVKGRKYTWLFLGDRQSIDFKYLKKIGKVEELTLEQIFGY